MKLIIEKNEQAMSESAMQIILGAMMQDKKVNISLTSGTSPRTMYKMMVPYVKDKPQFKDVDYYLFDEAPEVGEKKGQPGPNWTEMQELFFKDANIPDEKIHIPSMENYETFDEEIARAGGIDVMLIGLGFDGHFCSNCPRCTPMDALTYARARHVTVEANPNYPNNTSHPYSITMGPASLMKVKHLVLIVNGKHKAEIFKKFLTEPISEELPATILRLHPNFTVIADEDAASLLSEEDINGPVKKLD